MKTLIPLAAAFLIVAAPASTQAAMPFPGEVTLDRMQEVKHDRHWQRQGQKRWHKRRGGPPAHSRYKGPPPHSYYQGPPPHARSSNQGRHRPHHHSQRQHYRLPAPGGLHFHFSFPN